MMKAPAIYLILIACFFSGNSFSQDFHYLTLNVQNNTTDSQVSKLSAFPSGQSNLITSIQNHFDGTYEAIGNGQTQGMLGDSNGQGGASLNFSGFSWFRNFGAFTVHVNRQIAPELFSNKWIVHDQLIINVKATNLITKLKNEKFLNISNENLGAFAGLSFRRVYHYYHFAGSYLQGLTSDYSKLFLPFKKYDDKIFEKLQDYEILKKVDSYYFNAGGLAKAPIGNGLNASVGVLIGRAFTHEVTAQKLGPDDGKKENEVLRVNVDQDTNHTIQGELEVQMDFFNLLKLSLLKYELQYSYSKSHKSYYTFFKNDIEKIKNRPENQNAFMTLLKGKVEDEIWSDNIIALEEREKEDMSSKFSFLLYGELKKQATQKILIIKDDIKKLFYKTYSETVTYVQSLRSRFFSELIQKFFSFSQKVKNKAELKKTLELQYDATENRRDISKESKLSLKLTQKLFIANQKEWFKNSIYKKVLGHTQKLTNLPTKVIEKLERKELMAPIQIQTNILIDEKAIKAFNQLEEKSVITSSLRICKVSKSNFKAKGFYHKKKRASLFRQRLSGELLCAKNIIKQYFIYIEKYQKTLKIDIAKFQSFLNLYYDRVQDLEQLNQLFGEQNLFVHGTFDATSPDQKPFKTYFKTGQFKGLGVIDSFRREGQGQTTPISIE